MRKQEYKKNGNIYALVNVHAIAHACESYGTSLDCTTPYWVYFNNKLASKFADVIAAKDYIKVLMRY